MSTRADLVHSALTDEPQGRVALAEQLGLEPQAVSLELFALQAKGLAAKADGGWVVGSGKPNGKRHAAVEPAAAKVPELPRKRTQRRAPAVRVTTPPHRADPKPPAAVAGAPSRERLILAILLASHKLREEDVQWADGLLR